MPRILAVEIFYAFHFICKYQGPGKQTRHSGEPYLDHLAEVGWEILQIRPDNAPINHHHNGDFIFYLDDEAEIAALLHDGIEDTKEITRELIIEGFSKGRGQVFGERVANIVSACSKLPIGKFHGDKIAQTEEAFCRWKDYCRKDWMALPVKVKDRLHNMRTLRGLNQERRSRIALQTMEVMVPYLESEAKQIVPAEYHSWLEKDTKEIGLIAAQFLPQRYKISISIVGSS